MGGGKLGGRFLKGGRGRRAETVVAILCNGTNCIYGDER
jgi:hypothetical protein